MNDTANRPALAFCHANPRYAGCAVRFELNPAHDSAEGHILLQMAAQKMPDPDAERPRLPLFDWERPLTVRLALLDICRMVQVLRGKVESIEDGKGIYHVSAAASTKIVMRHICEPVEAYSLEAYQAFRDGSGDTSAHIMLTRAEALGLCLALESAIGMIAFGCHAPTVG